MLVANVPQTWGEHAELMEEGGFTPELGRFSEQCAGLKDESMVYHLTEVSDQIAFPGLLQGGAYVREIVRLHGETLASDVAQSHWAGRVSRGQLALQSGAQLIFLLREENFGAAVRSQVSPEVWREQLEYMLWATAQYPNVQVLTVPAGTCTETRSVMLFGLWTGGTTAFTYGAIEASNEPLREIPEQERGAYASLVKDAAMRAWNADRTRDWMQRLLHEAH